MNSNKIQIFLLTLVAAGLLVLAINIFTETKLISHTTGDVVSYLFWAGAVISGAVLLRKLK